MQKNTLRKTATINLGPIMCRTIMDLKKPKLQLLVLYVIWLMINVSFYRARATRIISLILISVMSVATSFPLTVHGSVPGPPSSSGTPAARWPRTSGLGPSRLARNLGGMPDFQICTKIGAITKTLDSPKKSKELITRFPKLPRHG